jgi:hypothetical protein
MIHILEVLNFETFETTRFVYADKAQAEAHVTRIWGLGFGLSINHVAL